MAAASREEGFSALFSVDQKSEKNVHKSGPKIASLSVSQFWISLLGSFWASTSLFRATSCPTSTLPTCGSRTGATTRVWWKTGLVKLDTEPGSTFMVSMLRTTGVSAVTFFDSSFRPTVCASSGRPQGRGGQSLCRGLSSLGLSLGKDHLEECR